MPNKKLSNSGTDNTPCPSNPVGCVPVASPVNEFAEIASPANK